MLKLYYFDISSLLTDQKLRAKALTEVQERRRTKVLRYAFLDDQCRSLAAGLCLKQALLDAGIDYNKESFLEGAKGRLSLERDCGIYFNLTHCGNIAICAISDSVIGVDAETVNVKGKKIENLIRIANRSFTENEQKYIEASLDESEKRARFAKIFTGKECYGKYIGVGLSYEMNHYEVLDNPIIFSFAFDDYIVSIAGPDIVRSEMELIEVEYA